MGIVQAQSARAVPLSGSILLVTSRACQPSIAGRVLSAVGLPLHGYAVHGGFGTACTVANFVDLTEQHKNRYLLVEGEPVVATAPVKRQ